MSIQETLTSGATEILNKLVPVVGREIGLAWGVKDDLKKLQDTLQMILAVIADAERRQVTEEAVRLWLRRLKSVAYDADDVMDDFSYETMRRSVRGNNLKTKVRDFLSSSNPLVFRFKMAKEIKHINQRLDAITKDMTTFQLQITPVNNTTISHGESSEQRSRQTQSSINESNIMGREDDKERIIDLLTTVIPSSSSSSTPSVSNHEKVSVISIVGMGGLGKTTLAQLVYKDKMVNEQFNLKMWVHVSEDFDVEKLLTKIMESSTGNKFDTLSNFDVLASKVREQLHGKRYLLVLDDLWNESDEQWERLCSPLLVGAQGSKILITTRQSQVADVVKGINPPYKLQKLQDDECWFIIEKKAFSPGGALKTAKMTSIGQKIAKRCGGLPLAAKFLGSLMRTRNREVDWLSIQENDIWNTSESQSGVMPVLKLSYDNLSSHLKQCFSYCSIFPKGWEISRITLVQLWIAEGFLDTSNVRNGRSIEDVADEYCESLVRSSFLDVAQKILFAGIMTVKMHDLVHDLARTIAGDQELVFSKVSEFKNTFEMRRLQLILDVDLSSTFLKSLSNEKKLRTLFIPDGSDLDPVMFLRNQHLRILHVGRSPKPTFPKLPSLSLKLRHLRYLHLTCLDLTEVVNDSVSINKLYNLETFIFINMKRGGGNSVEDLLRNIHSLKKLRHFNISHTKMEELPDSVTSLCYLETLDLSHCKLKTLPESATGLKNLRFLNISYNLIEELPGFISNLGNLQTLDVSNCEKLKSLPECVQGLDNLKIFYFVYCTLLEKLPENFGALTQLRYLSLDGTSIKVLPESCANLTNLEFVYLSNCELPKQVDNWTKVRIFVNYNKETPVGIGKLVCLEELTYWVREKLLNGNERNDGIEELENLNSLEMLEIMNLQNVKDPVEAKNANMKRKQNLRELVLSWNETEEISYMMWDQKSCNFQVFEALQPCTGLKKLEIRNFMGCNLPTWMCVPAGLPYLTHLRLANCKEIKQLPAAIGQFQHLTVLDLTELMSLKSLDIGGFPSLTHLILYGMFSLERMCSPHPCLRVLRIDCSRKLTEIPSFPSVKEFWLDDIDHQLVNAVGITQTSLTRLCLEKVKELIYFPISILQSNCNLRILSIKRCSMLEGFRLNEDQENENDATLLSPQLHSGCSLQELVLVDCPVLKFLPDLRGWTSLQTLYVRSCPKVKESLSYDLESLSFIKKLDVDFIKRD